MWCASTLGWTRRTTPSAMWPDGARGREMEELKASLECIRSTAAGLIDGSERRCPELFPEPPQHALKKKQIPLER